MNDYLYKSHPSIFKSHPVGFILCVLLGFLVWGIGFVILFIWWLKVKGILLTIDNRKTILRKGIFSKQTNEVYHSDVRNIQVSQSFFQQIFDVGTLQVSSAGQSNMEISVSGIPDPEKAKKIINNQRNKNQENGNNLNSTNQSTADELQKLADLKEQGIITETEFQQQKKNILG
ncbi:Short C-terminal domain-containing protein [Fodinibius roseus]|uniref:Short C-terminal domain-containing protein n=2 Tax=Fodinibius roseus TaxID=1194090 RepID=A0A1M5LR31_9BACT|nr:Short C-terminal domain-containing protein [Fodinibius roseus]